MPNSITDISRNDEEAIKSIYYALNTTRLKDDIEHISKEMRIITIA